jgi:hypothetical protein
MLLSEATESELLEALRAKMPKTLYGHEVTRVNLSMFPAKPTQSIGFHLVTKSGHDACGSYPESPDIATAAERSHFCVFMKTAADVPVVLADGPAALLLQEERFQ